MKKLLFIGVALLLSFAVASAQSSTWDNETRDNGFGILTEKPHEVKLNLLSTTIMLHPEIAYDYTIGTDMSVGARTSFSLKKGMLYNMMGDFQLSPYFRWHFYKNTKGNALRGFYVEGNVAYTYYNIDGEYSPVTTPASGGVNVEYASMSGGQFGIGIGLGYRWVTKGGWSFELGGTIGRNLVGNGTPEAYGSSIFSIGKRF